MTFQQLTWESFASLYHTAMAADFPPAERKPLPLLRRLWEAGVCSAWALTDADGTRLAYAVLEQPAGERACLLDYLAVAPSVRGQGVGGDMLRRLCALHPQGAVMLEIERVERAETPEQREERTRRRRFYLKNSVRPTGVFTRADGGVEYEILCLSAAAPLTGEDAARAMHRIYETLFAPGEYAVWEE